MFYISLVLFSFMIILVALSPLILQWLAGGDILFTTVKEGTVKAIMRGKSFDKFIMSFEGYHLNDPKKDSYDPTSPNWEVLEGEIADNRSWLLKHLGLHWIGWPWANSIYVYAFEWNETSTDNKGKERILPRAEATDYIFIADFTYAIETAGAETRDRLQTDETTLVTVAIRNPYRALFSGEDWMRRVTAAINRHVRNFVGGKDFQELIETKAENSTEFSKPIIDLTRELPDDDDSPLKGLHGRYGVEIRTADLQTIELSGDAKNRHEEATTREYSARQEAEAVRLEGQAKADVIKMIGDQEAVALATRLKIIKKHGDAGITLAGYDAIRESSKGPGNTVIWANNPLTSLAEVLKPKSKGE